MNTATATVRRFRCWAWLTGLVAAGSVVAFPPAPHHLVYGLVRDEMGSPLHGVEAEVLLEANSATVARTAVAASVVPGVNYRLAIPLDSGVTDDLYSPSALRPTVPFRMRVKVGTTTYLPIEMTGAANLLTRPGASSRVDLTLGVDSDGDGLPDAWERALALAAGRNLTLADIRPEADTDGDGMSNLDEYLAGTYAFDPADGFLLSIAAMTEGQAVLEFTAIRGRSYTIYGSDDLQQWTPVSFSLPTDSAGAEREDYQANETRLIRARVSPPSAGAPLYRFFKLLAH